MFENPLLAPVVDRCQRYSSVPTPPLAALVLVSVAAAVLGQIVCAPAMTPAELGAVQQGTILLTVTEALAVQPLASVTVREYVPLLLTVMEEVVAPVDHA